MHNVSLLYMRVIKRDNNFNAINRLLKIQPFLSFVLFQKNINSKGKLSFFQSIFKFYMDYKRKKNLHKKY
jgi:hypothetical protein